MPPPQEHSEFFRLTTWQRRFKTPDELTKAEAAELAAMVERWNNERTELGLTCW